MNPKIGDATESNLKLTHYPFARVRIITELMDHAEGDRMSSLDRTVCVRALAMLGHPYMRKRKRLEALAASEIATP